MVFHLPNQNQLRNQINYTEEFTYTLLWNVGLFGILSASLFIIFFFLKLYQLKILKNNNRLRESMITGEDRNSASNNTIQTEVSKKQQIQTLIQGNQNPKSIYFKIVNFFTSFFFYLVGITVCLIYLTFFMFGKFGRGTHIDVLSVILMTLIMVIPTLLWKRKTRVRELANIRGQVIFTVVMLFLWLCLSVFLVIGTKGACLCYYNDKYGFNIERDLSISSQFTRSLQLDTPCPEDKICHIYATVPQDTSSSFFLNIHAGTKFQTLSINLRLNQTLISSKNSSTLYKMDNVQQMGQRNLHSLLFNKLTENTFYNIQIKDSQGKILKTINYKTVPGPTAKELRMAVGGDLGMTKAGQQMTNHLTEYRPDIIILGGDTVYDDGMRSCYDSWDNFYNMFEPIYEELGYLVPLVMSIGNHDVGFDALTQNSITSTLQEIPLFFVFNPQHSAIDSQVPAILQRQSAHYHLVGPTIHLNLDSGYIKSYLDQVDFIKLNSIKYKNKYRFANYHNPIYPSCSNPKAGSNDRLVIQAGLKYWTPLFDEYKFQAAMEHHTHHRKFTYKIKNNTVNNAQGTRYIGDGSWGVTEDACQVQNVTPQPELMQNYETSHPNHMWQITLNLINEQTQQYSINYTAINLDKEVVMTKIEDLRPLV